MRFTRFHLYRLVILFLLAILVSSCSSADPSTAINGQGEDEPVLQICSQSPESTLFDLQAASVMEILIGDDKVEELGMDGAQTLANNLFSVEETFCGLGIPEALLSDLEEIQALYESGEDLQADELLDDLLQAVEEEEYSEVRAGKVSAPSAQAGGASVRRKVKNFLDIAGRAEYWGNDEKAQDALQAATDTYEKWAGEAVDTASIKEALRIAAEAQLLGLDGLGDEAIERARELAELDLEKEIMRFEPCKSTKEDTGRLLDTAARAQLLGIDTETYNVMGEVYDWLDIQKRRERGEEIPECDLWQVDLVLDEVWNEGFHHILWEGVFKVLEDGSLEGQGQGSLVTHVEVPCVNVLSGETTISTTDVEGSFVFQIEGRKEPSAQDGIFRFLFPAEGTYSGVDTCNDFDEDTFLPAYVIEEIHVYGGVENYDIETDTIFMALPAVDGASQVYETLIGPLRIEIHYLGSAGAESD